MGVYPEVLEKLIDALSFLPGVGRRSAERIAFYLVESRNGFSEGLSELIRKTRSVIKPCTLCNNFSLEPICALCRDSKRDKSVVCVVEHPRDILAIERTGVFQGLYFVLLGGISPLEGRTPEAMDVRMLENRIAKGEIKELVIATGSDNEGQLTALFLKDKFSQYAMKMSRIALGIPLGRQIEHTDVATLKESFCSRKPLI